MQKPEQLLVGFDSFDDAAVYQINDDTAIIQTVDFFPPIVDNPYIYGQIAAANALSDIYAMGGVPKYALNLLCIPSCLPLEAVKEILEGGNSKVQEAGAIIAGGHSIEDKEPKYGLTVTGFAHPRDILTNKGSKVGDILILTKPLGSGILSTASKAGLLSDKERKGFELVMSALNKAAAEAMIPLQPHACTDVTGFGFLGHVYEMAKGSSLSVEIFANSVPFMPKALEFAREGLIPAGSYRNMQYLQDYILIEGDIPLEMKDCMFDPQTFFEPIGINTCKGFCKTGFTVIYMPCCPDDNVFHNKTSE